MPLRQSSAFHSVLLLALVASVAVLAVSLTGKLAGYFNDTVAIEMRYGTLANRGLSVAVASAPVGDPTRLAAARYLASAGAALVVFEGVPLSVEVGGRGADLVWLDSGMAVRYLDEHRAEGSLVTAPLRTSFLLVLPDGYVGSVDLRRGERLQLI